MDIALSIALGVVVMALTAIGGFGTASKPWQRWVFGVGGVIGVLLIVAQSMRTANFQQELKKNQDILLEKTTEISAKIISPVLDGAQIVPGIYYPHEWDGYKGITRHDAVVVIDPDDPPRQKYSERVSLYITALNLNVGIPLEEGTINLRFVEDGLEITPGKGWKTGEPNKAYHRRFPKAITNAVAGSLSGPLLVRFPGPGKYHVLITIDGKWVKNPPLDKRITFELYD